MHKLSFIFSKQQQQQKKKVKRGRDVIYTFMFKKKIVAKGVRKFFKNVKKGRENPCNAKYGRGGRPE